MTRHVHLEHLDGAGLAWAQGMVTCHHYLHAPVPPVYRPEGWAIRVEGLGRLGCLIVGRPQATRCRGWYGSLADVANGWAGVSRWCVLCLARVWLSPAAQPGGDLHGPHWGLPGFIDRRGVWRSTLASTALGLLVGCVGAEYLVARPPCFLDEPYEVRWLMSYCDTTKHKGTIYRAAGWERYAVNAEGIETWRVPLPALSGEQHAAIGRASLADPRARRFRARRERDRLQLPLFAAS